MLKRIMLMILASSPLLAFGAGQGLRKLSTASYNIVFYMVDSTDHVTAKTGLSPAVTCSKNGASFGSVSGAITEIANGWYKLAGNATDTGTLGTLACYATATGADPRPFSIDIVTYDPFTYPDTSATIAGVTTAATCTTATTCSALTTNNDKTGYSLTSGYDPAKTAAQAGDTMKVSSGTGTGQINLSSGHVTNVDTCTTATTATTCTNLTNAPTSGDFTSAMKTSLNNSTPASVTGAVGSVTGAVGSVTGNVGGNVVGSVNSVTSRVTANVDQVDGGALASHASGHFPVDLLKIAGVTIDTTLAQLGVNVVKYGGTAGTFSSGIPSVNASKIGGTTQTGIDVGGTWTAARAAHLDVDISSRMATFALPLNFSAFSLTAAGRVDLGAINGGATDGNNATLKLATLDIRSPNGTAAVAIVGGTDGDAVDVSTSGDADVININATSTLGGSGIVISGGESGSTGAAVKLFGGTSGSGVGSPALLATGGDGTPTGGAGFKLIAGSPGAVDLDISTNGLAAPLSTAQIGVRVVTNADKAGYTLTQAFPANFADLAITASTGRVTVGTNADKTGYTLTVTPPTAAQVAAAVFGEPRAGYTAAGTFGRLFNALGAH